MCVYTKNGREDVIEIFNRFWEFANASDYTANSIHTQIGHSLCATDLKIKNK